MNRAPWLTGLVVVLIIISGVVCFGPWSESSAATNFLALIKLIALIFVTMVGFLIYARSATNDPQRHAWLLLAVAFVLFSVGQGVITHHQILLDIKTPFPSVADPPFVVSGVFYIWALFFFCVLAFRSGLPLGRPLVFWSPALAIFILFLAGVYPLLAPVIRSGGSWVEIFLNLYYPVSNFVALAPCTVMLRVGLKFRGGRLLLVWLPITLGFVGVLVSDILFAYMTSLNADWLRRLVDFFYVTGYLLIARGVLFQLNLLRS